MNRGATGYEASLFNRLTELQSDEFTVHKWASRHDGFGQETKVNFCNDVNGGRKHMPCMGLEVIVGKGRMKMSERLPAFSTSKVTLERDQF